MIDMFENNGAEFSNDGKYRYCLWRIWDETKPMMMFIGLNPSTANQNTDDPTIRRVKRFASDWGYGGVYMMNLFAWVTAYPEELKKCNNPIGENDKWLLEISKKCRFVVFAWGNFKEAQERSKEVSKLFENPFALQINQNGTPKHPLYVKADIQPVKYKR